LFTLLFNSDKENFILLSNINNLICDDKALFINKLSVILQAGYYVYYPVEVEGRVYERLGLKRYFKDKWFASISLKAHAAKAETVAFGIGIRL
jgi:hypothetical protein